MFNPGDKVRIGTNGYDLHGDPAEPPFKGETGEVVTVERDITDQIVAYQVELDNKELHTYLSGGDEMFTWPFWANELEAVDGA